MALISSISVQNGCPPWAPTRHTELLQPLKAYDGPLAGVVAQGDEHFLFYCLAGHVEPVSVWVYAALEHDDEVALREVTTCSFDAVVERILATRPIVVALAKEEAGIVLTTVVAEMRGASLPAGILAVLDGAQSSWRALLEPLAS
jgi:hypothetical protein